MDKYEYKLKLDELRELFQLKNYKGAAEIADEINWKKVRNAKTLCMVADVYEALERYDACQDVLMQAYDHTTASRNILSRLTDIAIKSKDVASAEEYYSEFLELAPRDTERYVYAYKIACLENAPLADRIAILEEFKEKEYSEMWAYELAVLYAQAGMREQCVETCDELILWFGDGEYVERALDLKRSFQPLTASQEEKYQKLLSQRGMVEINIPQKAETAAEVDGYAAAEELPAPDLIVTATKFNTQNLQDEITRSMQQIMDATEENTVRDQLNSIKKIVQDIPYLEGEGEESLIKREQIQEEVDQELKSDFQEKLVEETVYGQSTMQSMGAGLDDTSSMSIEEILADWEKTKAVAEEAMAAAEQKKLDLEKEQALAEANEIMRRLQELMPILSATPGEDIPDSSEGTVADELLSSEAIVLTPPEEREPLTPTPREETFFMDVDPTGGTLPESEAVTRPLQEVISQAARMTGQETPEPAFPEADDFYDEEEELGDTEAAGFAQSASSAPQAAPEFEEEASFGGTAGFAQSAPQSAPQFEDTAAFGDAGFEESAGFEDAAGFGESAGFEDAAGFGESAGFEDAAGFEKTAGFEDTAGFKETADFANAPGFEETQEFGPIGTDEFDDAPTEPLDAGGYEEPYAAPNAAATQELTDEIISLFSYFLPIPGMTEQIAQVLGDTVRIRSEAVTSASGNVIVQGEEGSGKTMLATNLIKAIQKTVGREDDKIGKINAEALNTRDFASLVPKIEGGYLIVENAGSLNPDTVAAMAQAMDQDTGGMTVVLEDNSAGIRRVMALDPDFAAKFTQKIKIPIFTIDELVDFGKAYALEQECEIEQMAVLALYNRINNIQKADHPTTLTEVKAIVDEAIDKAESGGLKKLFAKKYNDDDYLILHEEDFD